MKTILDLWMLVLNGKKKFKVPNEILVVTPGAWRHSSKPNPNPNPKKPLSFGLGLVLGFFGLVCTPLGKDIAGPFLSS